MDEVLNSGQKHASGFTAVSQGNEMIPVGRETEDDLSKVFWNANRTAIFEKTDEPTNIRNVPGPLKLSPAIAHATAPHAPTSMEGKALNDGSIHLTEWRAMSLRPAEKMTSSAGAGFEGREADLSLDILGQKKSAIGRHATRGRRIRRNV
ncbi:UNVERIFIED_ORG: hypothetical protein ABIC54_006353 [Burkholderia sp. 1263]